MTKQPGRIVHFRINNSTGIHIENPVIRGRAELMEATDSSDITVIGFDANTQEDAPIPAKREKPDGRLARFAKHPLTVAVASAFIEIGAAWLGGKK